MAGKDFKRTVKTVSKNFQKYTEAMEADIQSLIASMLDVIENKIIALRKLLKLKLCVKNVRSIAGLEYMANMEDFSLSPTYTTFNKDERKECDSLDDLTSMVYEVDKNSLPAEEDFDEESNHQRKLKLLDDVADLESLCSALNPHNSATLQQEEPADEPLKALDKYIYLLLDAERRKEKNKETEETKEIETQKIGDFASQRSNVDLGILGVHPSDESVVYLGKTEYESILNILNMVLRSYKVQEEIAKRNKTIEKARTEPNMNNHDANRKKFLSEGTCPQQSTLDKKIKNRKNCCV